MSASKSMRSLRFRSVDDMPAGMRALYEAQTDDTPPAKRVENYRDPEPLLVLPWPARALHPNARKHWGQRSPVVKAARQEAHLRAVEAGWQFLRAQLPADGRLYVWLDGFPPNRRTRDRDGLQASMKSALDGIADAMGVNDSRFFPITDLRDPLPPHGAVHVRITTTMERPE